jgi:hypothetical protein
MAHMTVTLFVQILLGSTNGTGLNDGLIKFIGHRRQIMILKTFS